MIAGKEASGAAEARLNLVGDQEHVIVAADFLAAAQVAGRWNNDAAFALDGLDEKRGRIGRYRGFEGICVAIFHDLESRRQRAEVLLVFLFRRERNDCRGAPVEIPGTHDDLRLVGFYAFGLVAPAPRSLHRRLHGLRPRIHRQGHVLARQFAGPFEERAQLVRVKGPGNDAKRFGLGFQRLHEARVCMPVTDRGIGAHHVQVLLAVLVPDVHAFASCEHDRQRMVVVRAILVFKLESG